MKHLILSVTVLASFLFLSWNVMPSQNNPQAELPIKGAYHTNSLILSGPPMLSTQITGIGQSSHLGKGSFVAYSTVNFTTPPPFSLGGTAVFTAANGDEFYTTFTGTAMPTGTGSNEIEMHHTITGGTGRFENVSGTLNGYTIATPGHANGYVTYEGSISY